jgi:hypothetical protein
LVEIGELVRLRRDRLFAEIVFQQASMPDEGGVVGRSGDIKAGEAVEKAETNEVGSEKPPEGSKGSLRRGPLCFFLKPRFQIKIGKIVDLGNIAGNGRI